MKPSLPHFARHLVVRFAVVTLVLAGSLLPQSHAQNSTFNYQGVLTAAGIAANGAFDLQFRLYDEAEGGTQIGPTVLREEVAVRNGLFTVPLDFGIAAFSGARRYLEIGVRIGASTGGFSLLTPREPINPTPYAISSVNFTGPLAGDVVGSQGATTVVAIQGRPISSNAPGNGQVLGYNAATNRYEPVNVATAANNSSWDIVTESTVQLQANRRYAIDSSSRASLSLPTAPNKGDIVEIHGIGNGWQVVRGATGQYIAGYEWSAPPLQPVHPNRDWNDIAVTADGNRIYGAADRIYISTDRGLSWTQIGNEGDWESIATSADGSRLIACKNNKVFTSADYAMTWTERSASCNGTYKYVAMSANGDRFVACAQDGAKISTDGGMSWTTSSVVCGTVAASSSGSKLVAASGRVDFASNLFTSTDGGVTWTARGSGQPWLSVASSPDGNHLIANASPAYGPFGSLEPIYASSDSGISWRNIIVPVGVGIGGAWRSFLINSIAGVVRYTASTVAANQVFISNDSGTTFNRTLVRGLVGTGGYAFPLASSADGAFVAAAEPGGQINTSTDGGLTWSYPTQAPSPNPGNGPGVPLICGGTGSRIELIYAGNGKFIPTVSKLNISRYQDGCP